MKLIKRLNLSQTLAGSLTVEKQGQSLVEFALVVPILLLLLLGVFEVGYALRGYLALANVNREATRFAARGIYLDFDEKTDPNLVGYEKVVSHTLQSLANQLAMDILGTTPNAVEIITFYRVEPENFGCPGDPDCSAFDCSLFDYENRNDASFVAGETLNQIEYPYLWTDNAGDPDMPAYYETTLAMANTTPISAYHYYKGANDVYSRIDPAEMVLELRSRSNLHNCELVKKKLPPTKSDYVVVENIFYQKPLVGMLPFIGDTIPMYTHTVMRVTSSIRETSTEPEPVCELYPIMVKASTLSGLFQGDQVTIEETNLSNPLSGNFNWTRWNADQNPANNQCDRMTICDNLQNPGNAATDFLEPYAPGDSPDTQINIGDWVPVMTGVNNSGSVRTALEGLETEQKYMRMPVWYDGDCATGCSQADLSGAEGKYRIMTFVVMKVTQINYQNAPRNMVFEFDHYEPNACVGTE